MSVVLVLDFSSTISTWHPASEKEVGVLRVRRVKVSGVCLDGDQTCGDSALHIESALRNVRKILRRLNIVWRRHHTVPLLES